MKLSLSIRETKFSFDLLILVLFILFPFKIVIYFIASLFFHELGHYIIATLLGYKVNEFRISLFNSFVLFEDKITNLTHSLFISVAGVFMNFLLGIYAYFMNMPELFLFNLFLIIFNLIPIRSLDGNYALKSILDLLNVKNSEKITDITGIITACLISILLVILGEYIMAISLIIMMLSLNIR